MAFTATGLMFRCLTLVVVFISFVSLVGCLSIFRCVCRAGILSIQNKSLCQSIPQQKVNGVRSLTHLPFSKSLWQSLKGRCHEYDAKMEISFASFASNISKASHCYWMGLSIQYRIYRLFDSNWWKLTLATLTAATLFAKCESCSILDDFVDSVSGYLTSIRTIWPLLFHSIIWANSRIIPIRIISTWNINLLRTIFDHFLDNWMHVLCNQSPAKPPFHRKFSSNYSIWPLGQTKISFSWVTVIGWLLVVVIVTMRLLMGIPDDLFTLMESGRIRVVSVDRRSTTSRNQSHFKSINK